MPPVNAAEVAKAYAEMMNTLALLASGHKLQERFASEQARTAFSDAVARWKNAFSDTRTAPLGGDLGKASSELDTIVSYVRAATLTEGALPSIRIAARDVLAALGMNATQMNGNDVRQVLLDHRLGAARFWNGGPVLGGQVTMTAQTKPTSRKRTLLGVLFLVLLLEGGLVGGWRWLARSKTEYAPRFDESTFRSLSLGISEDAAVQKLGVPLSKEAIDATEVWRYTRPLGKSFSTRSLIFDHKRTLIKKVSYDIAD